MQSTGSSLAKDKPTSVRHLGHYIGGEIYPSSSGRIIERRNPANNRLIATWPDGTREDVDLAVQAARAAFADGRWSDMPANERSKVLRRTGDLLKDRCREFAEIESAETGKPLKQALDEVPWTADLWDFAAGQARALHGDSHANVGREKLGLVLREPIGVVGMITPWNYPLLVLSQKLVYALAAGCTVVAKPSELTSGTTILLASLLEEAGLPAGVFNVVTGYGDPVGKCIAEHHDIDMVSFTGSTAVGRSIMAAASANLKKVVVELGGKNPSIVFADADLNAAVDGVVKGILYNAGEECCSGSRLFVQNSILEIFTKRVCAAMGAVTVGDPLDERTTVGAIVDRKQYDKVLRYIEEGKRGARVALGGGALKLGEGLFIQPTVFTHVTPDLSIARDEIFGPVLAILSFETKEEAARLANETIYGLASSVWTRDLDTALYMARAIRAGLVWVNTFLDVPTEVPIGGVKQSGIGRENGRQAIEEFTNLKTVVIHSGSNRAWFLDTNIREGMTR